MITVDSIIENSKHTHYHPVSFGSEDGGNTLLIYIFNGDPYDADIVLARLNMQTLVLKVIGCGEMDLGLGFCEGWAFDKYDWLDIKIGHDKAEAAKALLNSNISEEQFLYEILYYVDQLVWEEMYIVQDTHDDLKNVKRKLYPIVEKQTDEASEEK